MIHRIPREKRHFRDAGWLQTYWLFSFSDYYDPENIRHGALRVFNDDVVEAGKGFPEHPHANYEIITIILDGALTHWDSGGHRGEIKAGDVQRMSAGSGVYHSEFNLGKGPVHLYQIWIKPSIEDLTPSYDQRHFDLTEKNKLIKLVSPQGSDSLLIHNDVTLYYGLFDADQKLQYATDTSRNIFMYLKEGEVFVNNLLFSKNDQARIERESLLQINIDKGAEFVVIDVPRE